MNRALVVTISTAAVLTLTFLAVGQARETAQKIDAEQVVMALDNEWAKAATQRDLVSLNRVLADDLVYTHNSGRVDTKAKFIAAIKSNQLVIESIDRDDLNTRVYGDAAVITGRYMIKVKFKGKDVSGNTRYIHVYAKQNGRWQMVAHQATSIVQ